MAYTVRVERDSVWDGRRITTLVCTYPRIIHAEIMTHRMFCRNAASSRAIPVKVMLQQLRDDPFIPLRWGKNQPGMQQAEQITEREQLSAEALWLSARDAAVTHVEKLVELGLHKSLPNRMLEPWSWITTIITATEWANFFRQRMHPDAEVHFQKLAKMMFDAMEVSNPNQCRVHMPFLDDEEHLLADACFHTTKNELAAWAKISSARCARVSYLTQDGERNIGKDLQLADRLTQGSGFGHWSPFEHVAFGQVSDRLNYFTGPFRGWYSYRSTIPQENLAGQIPEYKAAVAEFPELMI